MKIELRKLKIALHMSEETTAFTADIFIDGVEAGYARNDGRGGCTDYHAYTGKRDLIVKAEKHCLTLPPVDYGTFKHEMTLELFIEGLMYDELEKKEKAKEQKKFEKKFTTALIFEHGTKIWTVDLKKPLAGIPQIELQRIVDLYKNKMKATEAKATLMNNNLEKLGIKL